MKTDIDDITAPQVLRGLGVMLHKIEGAPPQLMRWISLEEALKDGSVGDHEVKKSEPLFVVHLISSVLLQLQR